MSATRVRATRTELIAKKNQIKIAGQGRDLLKKKNDVLIARFMEVMKEVVRSREELETVATEANYAHIMAKALDGRVPLLSAAFALNEPTEVEVGEEKIMGLSVPTLSHGYHKQSIFSRGLSPVGISSRVEEVADRFQEVMVKLLTAADKETRLKRLAGEIQKTRRRVNALDNLVLPQLKEEIRYINLMLSEREREELYRVKKVKKKIQKKKLF